MVRLWEAANDKVDERQRRLQEVRQGARSNQSGVKQREET